MLGIYSIVVSTDVTANVCVPPGGISAIESLIQVVDPLVIFVRAVRYILDVVTKYSEGIPDHNQCEVFAMQRFAF